MRSSRRLQHRREQLESTVDVISKIIHAGAAARSLRPPGIATVLAVAGREAARQVQAMRCLAQWHRPATRRRRRDRGAADQVVRQASASHRAPGHRARARRASALASSRPCWPDSGQTQCGPHPAQAHRDGGLAAAGGGNTMPCSWAHACITARSLALGGGGGPRRACGGAGGGGPPGGAPQTLAQPPRPSTASSAVMATAVERVWTIVDLPGWMAHMRVLHAHGNGGMHPLGQGERRIAICRAFAAARRSLACVVTQRAKPATTRAPGAAGDTPGPW